MKKLKTLIYISFFILIAGCETNSPGSNSENAESSQQAELSKESIYQLDGQWQDQEGDTFKLSELKGKIPIVAMIFTSCGYACPRIVADLKNIRDNISQAKQDEMRYVLVSFDTERDQPEKLKKFSQEMQLDDQWILLHGNENDVRELSMLLGVNYKKMPDGNFAHSNEITLLNKKGEIVAQVEGLGVDAQGIIEKVKEL